MALKLGTLTLDSGVVQSPMAACTDLPFRIIAREVGGLEFAFTEMVSANALLQGNIKTLGLMKTIPGDRPLGCQLVGCDPDVVAAAAPIVEEMGYDVLDLNLGCPVPKITGGGEGAGSALLCQPAKSEDMFRKVVKAVKRVAVTVKMRIGFNDPSGAEAVEIAKRAEGAGVSALAVHGRTRAQQYAGRADYEAIGRVKAAVKVPVIGNGDVRTGADALRLKAVSGCDGVMIGRGALGNPWIYREVAAALRGEEAPPRPTFEERRAVLLRHLELEREHCGERLALLQMRRIGAWYISGVPGAVQFRDRMCRAGTLEEMRSLIRDFCYDEPVSRRNSYGEESQTAGQDHHPVAA